jgi:hypothetical protein
MNYIAVGTTIINNITLRGPIGDFGSDIREKAMNIVEKIVNYKKA